MSQNSELFHGAFDQASRIVARGIENFAAAARNGIDFQGDDEITTSCRKVWGLIENSKVLSDDATVDVVKKAALAFFIMLPAAHFIKDALDHTGLTLFEMSATLKESLIYLEKSFAYIFIVVTIIDYLLPEDGAEKTKKPVEVQQNIRRERLPLDIRYVGHRI